MRCLKDKKLILYFYKDLNGKESEEISQHLKSCPQCISNYQKIEALNSKIDSTPIELNAQETEEILQRVKGRIDKVSTLDKISGSISGFLKQAIRGLSYRPRLVTVAVTLVVVLALAPFVGKRNVDNIEIEFDILAIQMELAAEDSEASIFELYEDDPDLFQELTLKNNPIRLS